MAYQWEQTEDLSEHPWKRSKRGLRRRLTRKGHMSQRDRYYENLDASEEMTGGLFQGVGEALKFKWATDAGKKAIASGWGFNPQEAALGLAYGGMAGTAGIVSSYLGGAFGLPFTNPRAHAYLGSIVAGVGVGMGVHKGLGSFIKPGMRKAFYKNAIKMNQDIISNLQANGTWDPLNNPIHKEAQSTLDRIIKAEAEGKGAIETAASLKANLLTGSIGIGAGIGTLAGTLVGSKYGALAGVGAGLVAGTLGATIPMALGSAITSVTNSGLGLDAVKAVAGAGMRMGGSIVESGMALERGARGILTGGLSGTPKNAVDAWFPHFRALRPFKASENLMNSEGKLVASKGQTVFNIKAFAPNPKAIRRMAVGQAIASMGSYYSDVLSPRANPATVFFDGEHIRHMNDLGAHGGYAQQMLGRNSNANLDSIASTARRGLMVVT